MVRILRIGAFAVALAIVPIVSQGESAQEQARDQAVVTKADLVPPKLRRAFEGVVREYLLKNPAIIREAMQALRVQEEAEEQAATTQALEQYRAQLLLGEHSPIAGNPNGDITVVQFFDYNCGYCKRVVPAVAAVIKNDPNVRVVYKEFAILGPQSIVAARAALAARRQGKYHEFHVALMSAKQADAGSVAAICQHLDLDYAKLVKDMADPEITEELERNYRLATALGIRGTPAFVIGDRLVPGAVDERAITEIIVAERAKMKSALTGN